MKKKDWISSAQCIYAIFAIVFLFYGIICLVWEGVARQDVRINGKDAIATVIRFNNSVMYYDIAYQGRYYVNYIKVVPNVYNSSYIGEHFPARFLPTMIKHYDVLKRIPLAPLYIEIDLSRLSSQYQDVDKEKKRVDSLYYRSGTFSLPKD